MTKKKDNSKWFILILLALVIIIIGAKSGWFSSTQQVTYVDNNYGDNTPTTPTQDTTSTDGGLDLSWFNDLFGDSNDAKPTPETLIPGKIYTCTDSDVNSAVNQYFVASDVTDQDGTTYLDICSSGKLLEQTCDGPLPSQVEVNCADYNAVCVPDGARGKCQLKFCDDMDGGLAYDARSYCEDNFGKHYDVCSRSNTITEYYCRNSQCTTSVQPCANTCSNAQCYLPLA